MHHEVIEPTTYGLMAEFESAEELLAAAKKVNGEGYRKVEAFTPFPVHGISEALKFKDERVPWIVFLGGLTGASLGLLLQWYTSVIDYPLNVGGKPLFSLVSFVPVTFECTILFASIGGVFGMLALNGFPQPYHSVFNAENFERASQDRFFLCIESTDAKFDDHDTRAFMNTLGALNVSEVKP